MKKIWLFSIIGFGLIATAAIATLITLYFLSDDVEEYVTYVTSTTTETTSFTSTQTTTEKNEDLLDFSTDFSFGAASSSYQIEGAYDVDGKTLNIWDTLTHNMPEKVYNGDTGDVSADSYHKYKDDVKAIKDIGFNFYRFSISWSRILPDGAKTNQAGIDYYNNLINELIANGIEPMVTMYHWDLPQYIQDIGGWTNEVILDYFDHYADVLYDNFGDRVKKWITLNEPYIFCHDGYGTGRHAPAIESKGDGEYLCGHHALLAHVRAYHNYKNKYQATQRGEVGICLYSANFYPSENVHLTLAETALQHMLGWFANPIFSQNGNYPQVMIDNIKRNSENEGRPWSRLPEFTSEQIASLKGSSDFLALNYYTSRLVQPKENYSEEYGWEDDAGIDQSIDPSWPKAKSDFLYSVPEGLHDLLVWIKNKTIIQKC
ncbi:hypothetical protein PVAND_003677 [Polypedilum vanderplanki]|uniref:Uncharacterized protein n=1 Tax=Polypedilum vanderplanki TaxID=319348 RepID=A0A9J6BUS4_POLVA|nr:hypothetical protein PVAND_003677 [Polypedilum vanderplanki]